MTDIIWYDRVDSTNNLARLMMKELNAPTVIAAREQTAGRGQRGNSWKSEPGSNLTFSLVLKEGDGILERIPVACQFVISEAVALGVTDYLAAEGVQAKIKWPNDIYVGNLKICGILIETAVAAGKMTNCIAGIGLNLNQTCFPAGIPNPVSLSMVTGRGYGLEETLAGLTAFIMNRLESVHSDQAALRQAYLDRMYGKDECRRFTYISTGTEFTGYIRGISDSARLQVETEDGSVREFMFKEIGYIIS